MLLFRDTFRLRFIFFVTLLLVSMFFAVLPVSAQSNSAIAQQFQTTQTDITPASLVGIKKDNPNDIELIDIEHVDQLVGIVSSKPLIELSNGGSGVQVVTSGITMALVSDLNGEVVAGDKITASPIAGIGMKASDAAVVVGTSQAALDSVQTETREITDLGGKKQSVRIGVIPVQVSVAFYSPETDKDSAFVPPFLQSLANNVTGRNVSPVRVLVAALILLLVFLSITVLLYSSVRSSIISIGRNPLSESAVRKSLFEVALTVLTVVVFAVVVVYLILTV